MGLPIRLATFCRGKSTKGTVASNFKHVVVSRQMSSFEKAQLAVSRRIALN